MKTKWILLLGLLSILIVGCQQEAAQNQVDAQQPDQKKKLHREEELLRKILEMKNEETLTYTYYLAENGKKVLLGETIGYGIPCNTRLNNPQKRDTLNGGLTTTMGPVILASEENGLFPSSFENGTWIFMKDPVGGKEAKPILVQVPVIVSPFRIPE